MWCPKEDTVTQQRHYQDLQYLSVSLHNIPDNARSVKAGCDTLFVIILNLNAGHGTYVLLQNFHQFLSLLSNLPDPHLKTSNKHPLLYHLVPTELRRTPTAFLNSCFFL